MVICTGGGGIPTMLTPDGVLDGVEAVIDKDHAGRSAGDVHRGRGVSHAHRRRSGVGGVGHSVKHEPSVARLPRPCEALRFAAGSMGPKVEAACDFAERPAGGRASGRWKMPSLILKGGRAP